MILLLDTHVALWAIADDPKLSPEARKLLLEPENTLWVSAASVWEIAIKHALQRGDMPISGESAISYFRASGYRILPIEAEHAAAVENLPMHHADPFDRLLIAQSRVGNMWLVSHDEKVARYGDPVIVV
ncbi:type II toxin-antitoxin system VapC family toxin [Thiohalocapsa marina]|uniref:Type II toxin-antitoxin system VapC family toxin n=1 Tax=Thiohalocapsa marina TaxID=424902 RepID=A0A5M8FNH3_9GAMM|nr:type II toxin-antitoxin system VapC family toxin [Thiohalocapsa marina]KAA6186347.1 type II toxin-antitoxin system VapC family toxin [Thiohalocapsa marina]